MTDINCRQKGDLRRMMVKSFQDYHRSDYRDPSAASDWELWRAAWRAGFAAALAATLGGRDNG